MDCGLLTVEMDSGQGIIDTDMDMDIVMDLNPKHENKQIWKLR
jgi:hypothetical protein